MVSLYVRMGVVERFDCVQRYAEAMYKGMQRRMYKGMQRRMYKGMQRRMYKGMQRRMYKGMQRRTKVCRGVHRYAEAYKGMSPPCIKPLSHRGSRYLVGQQRCSRLPFCTDSGQALHDGAVLIERHSCIKVLV